VPSAFFIAQSGRATYNKYALKTYCILLVTDLHTQTAILPTVRGKNRKKFVKEALILARLRDTLQPLKRAHATIKSWQPQFENK
jgi:hypothetical protein